MKYFHFGVWGIALCYNDGDSPKKSKLRTYKMLFSYSSSPLHTLPSDQISSQRFRIRILSRTLATLRIKPHRLPARRVPLYIIIHARKRPPRLIQRHRPISKNRIRKRLIEINRVPLTLAIRQNQRLRDELVERVRRVRGRRNGEEIGIDGLFDDAGAGDGVGDDDVFDLGDVLGGRGGELLVGGVVGDEGGDAEGGAFEGADDG